MTIAVGTGEQRGVAGSGARIGVVVKAIGEVSAMIEQESKSGVAELVAVALEIVAAELVDDDDDDELGVTVVG